MRTSKLTFWIAVLAAFFLCVRVNADVSFEWSFIDSPANPADRATGFGAVENVYRLSKHEVTNDQYAEFLNKVAPSDLNGLFNPNMQISRRGEDGSFVYEANAGFGLHPVVYVSFFDAMRFTNWLHNGQPAGQQSVETTEGGAYDLSSELQAVREANANYFVPTEDEWFKAAYYNPQTQFYQFYPIGSNQLPIGQGPVSGSRSVNMMAGSNGTGFEETKEVGIYSRAQSHYGTFDQAGNVWEWNETVINEVSRGTLGGGFYDIVEDSTKDLRNWQRPRLEAEDFGFRVASVPEPNAVHLSWACATAIIACSNRRRRPISNKHPDGPTTHMKTERS